MRPDVGIDAWISRAGHLPYGQPLDQRHDDADSLTWDFDPDGLEIAGNALVELSLSSSAPVATVSAKLTDVAADGTSTLVTRGTLNLTRRGGMDTAEPLEPRTGRALSASCVFQRRYLCTYQGRALSLLPPRRTRCLGARTPLLRVTCC